MDFTNRAARPAQSSNQQVISQNHPGHQGGGGGKSSKFSLPFSNLSTALLLVSATVVVIGLIWLLIFAKGPSEAEFVDTNKLQAVFLNGGQVYFGNITSVNNKFMRLNNIYYLRVEQQVQPEQQKNGQSNSNQQQKISLAKLGCELHGPQDQMILNKDQILFWENLKKDGKVTEAVKKFVQANPKGQDCSKQATQAGQ